MPRPALAVPYDTRRRREFAEADELAQAISSGELRLNPKDPEADKRFTDYLEQNYRLFNLEKQATERGIPIGTISRVGASNEERARDLEAAISTSGRRRWWAGGEPAGLGEFAKGMGQAYGAGLYPLATLSSMGAEAAAQQAPLEPGTAPARALEMSASILGALPGAVADIGIGSRLAAAGGIPARVGPQPFLKESMVPAPVATAAGAVARPVQRGVGAVRTRLRGRPAPAPVEGAAPEGFEWAGRELRAIGAEPPASAPIPAEMPATQRVFNRISLEEPTVGRVERLQQGLHRFNRSMLDDLHPLSEYVKVAKQGGLELSLEENPYIWARLLRGQASKGNVMLERGTFGKKFWRMEQGQAVPNFRGPGLEQVLTPVKEPTALRDFTTYLTSKRAVELSGKEIVTGIAKEDAVAAIAELEARNPHFPAVARDLYKYQNDLLDYAREMGLLDQALVNRLKTTHQSYVPFHRVFEETAARGFMGKKMVNLVSPIKRIKGSERPIVNPLESITKNTHLLVGAADRNHVGILMANMVERNPELAGLFKRIPAPTARVARVTAKELGISLEGMTPADTEAVFNVFRPSMFTKENVATVLVDGKRHYFQVDPDLYRGLVAMDRDSLGSVMQFLSYPAKWLRAGATLSPDFMVRNPIRDQMTAFAYSRYGFIPGVDWLRGMGQVLGKTDEYLLYKMSGGERAMLVSMDRQYLQKSFKEIVEGKGFTDYVKRPLDLLQIGSELGEKGTRMGEFVKGIRAGATPLEAGFASREVTLDFAKMGVQARTVNSLIAFFNANVRGWDMMVQSFRHRPVQTSFKVFTGITLPSMALYMVNRDNPRYQEIPQWQKDLFWIIIPPGEDSPIIRIPKPFELGILFGSVPERFLQYLDEKDPELLKETMRNAMESGSPGFIPTAGLPVLENMTNYSFFRQRPIVSKAREGMPPELQYGGYTSEAAKKLGEWVKYSPAKIDNLLYGWSGGLGRYAMEGIDALLKGTGIVHPPPDPSRTLADLPVLKSFIVRDPYGSSSESVDRFYKELERYEAGEKYLKEMLNLAETEKFEAYKRKHPEILLFYDDDRNDHYSASARYFRRMARWMSEIRKVQVKVYNARNLTPQEKRAKIDESNKLLTEVAKKALEKYKVGATQ